MSSGHCFISYSHADGLEFVTKLADELESGHPFTKVWFEKREIIAGREDWDSQLASAIQNSKCLLFVMSKDSTAENSNCKEEWVWALKYKKPVICLLIDKEAKDQFRLSSRQKVDFESNFDAGLAKLRKTISHLDSPAGELEELKYRLADANRDLRRASPEEQLRIQAEIEELNKQIQAQQNIVDNPKAAEEQTQRNIETGLERERQPEKPVATKTSTKFINPPPGIAPNYYQDRQIETKQIVDFLKDDSKRLMTIVGRAGVGKTALICRLLKGIENGQLPDDLGEMKADGIVYLSEAGSHRINFANIFSDLIKLLPNEVSSKLESLYKNPQTSTGDKMRALLDAFTDGRIILLLDNFENLIDSENLNVKDNELSDALNTLLYAPQHTVKVIITTRIAPRDLALVESGKQRILSLDDGLESPYAENVLRELDADGHIGLKDAPEELLIKAREKTRGYPRALEALYAILSVDRYTTLEELLAIKLPDEVVHTLVGEAFNRLDLNAQMVMQALAIYNRPVSPSAIDYLLQPHLPSVDSALVLNRLVNMHFARREAGRYYLHPADREYAISTIPEKETNFSQQGLLNRAADYFAQARKPRTEWKKLDDLSAQLAEFDLRCEAEDYNTAADVLNEIDFDCLLLWGHYLLMIQMHEKLVGKINDSDLKMSNFNGLGLAYRNIGDARKSITYFEQGVSMASEAKSRSWEGTFLGNLGNAYSNLGQTRKAIEFYKQALVIDREIGDRQGEANALGNLGNAYSNLGEIRKAIKFYEQALVIDREIGSRHGEGQDLGNLGHAYADLGDAKKAIELYEQRLVIAREIGDRRGEGINLLNTGITLLSIKENQIALEKFSQSVQIGKEISSLQMQVEANSGIAQAYLFQNDLPNALDFIEAVLQYNVPEHNHNASSLHGIIALRQGDKIVAQEAFLRALRQADEILSKTVEYYEALDAKGLAICGLTICDDKKYIEDAIESFQKARKIAPHAGIIKSVLRLFDELAKCDKENILKDVRKAVEGKE